MPFLEEQISFLSNYASNFSAIKHNSYVFFSRSIIYLGQKHPIAVHIFKIFESLGQCSSTSLCQFWTDKSIPFQIFHHSSVSLHITLQIFSSCIFCFGQTDPIKVVSVQVKICQIPCFIFQTTSDSILKFCFTRQCHER